MGGRLRCRSRQNLKRYFHRNQQYSVTAITDGSGGVRERYAYSAYGTPTITDASGTTRTTTAIGNRYTYTGREYDETLALYHYRARMYDSVAGRFVSRDPIGFEGSQWALYGSYLGLQLVDPFGNQAEDPQELQNEIKNMEREMHENDEKIKKLTKPEELKEKKRLQDRNSQLRRDIKIKRQWEKRLRDKIKNNEGRGNGGRRGGGRIRCLGPIMMIIDAIDILVDPEGYWEHETEPWENKPPILISPLGPIPNPSGGNSA